MTSGFYNDEEPVFDPDGKYLYFKTGRTFGATYSELDNSWIYANGFNLAAVPLRKDTASPFAPRNDEETDKKKDEEKKSDEKKPDEKKSEEKKSDEKKVIWALAGLIIRFLSCRPPENPSRRRGFRANPNHGEPVDSVRAGFARNHLSQSGGRIRSPAERATKSYPDRILSIR